MILLWPLSIILLIKGTDIFWRGIENWKRLAWGGALVMAITTSLPELFLNLSSSMFGLSEMAVAHTVGSNIFNIFVVVGLLACFYSRLSFPLISRHLSILAIATIVFVGVVTQQAIISFPVSLFLIITYILLSFWLPRQEEVNSGRIRWSQVFLGVGMIISSSFLLVLVTANTFHLPDGYSIISVTLLAAITSLPEVILAWRAIRSQKAILALQSVIGSNVFNVLIALGIPALFYPLLASPVILSFAVPVMILATLLLIVAGLSRHLYRWEGFAYLALYALFIWRIL